MTITSGWYAADGSVRVTMVDGSVRTGVYAADGSLNAQLSPGGSQVGMYSPCGAWYVTVAPSNPSFPLPYHAPDGSIYIMQATGSGFNNAGVGIGLGMPVTIVGGSNPFSPGTPGAIIPLLAF